MTEKPDPQTLAPYDWTRAREDFLSGEPAVFVAARLGVSERTVTRRAAQEGWRRRDQNRRAFMPPPLDPTLTSASELDMLMEGADIETEEMLEDGHPRRSIRYAYHRLNEAAVRKRPAEALSWARLIEALDRIDPTVRSACGLHSDADGIRAIRREVVHARHAAQIEDLLEALAEKDETSEPFEP